MLLTLISLFRKFGWPHPRIVPGLRDPVGYLLIFFFCLTRSSFRGSFAFGLRRIFGNERFPACGACYALGKARGCCERYGFPIVCDCHNFLPGLASVSRDNVAREHLLFETADLIVFSARHLMDNARGAPACSRLDRAAPSRGLRRTSAEPCDI